MSNVCHVFRHMFSYPDYEPYGYDYVSNFKTRGLAAWFKSTRDSTVLIMPM